MVLQNVILWDLGYFELKSVKTQRTQEKHFPSPLAV